MLITSVSNPRVKHVIALRERKQRKRDNLMVVDGFDELWLALNCGAHPTEVFTCADLFHTGDNAGLTRRINKIGVEVFEVPKLVFEKIAYRENPDGWLAVFPIPNITLDELVLSSSTLLVIAESLEKPGNLGAILRSADAAGADAVILCDPTIDIGNPNVIRASRGTVFSVKIANASTEEAVNWLAAHSVQAVAATPEANTLYTDLDLQAPIAIVVGTEREGLSEFWRQSPISSARIPMTGKVNSINVAQATTLFLFEAVRQRAMSL